VLLELCGCVVFESSLQGSLKEVCMHLLQSVSLCVYVCVASKKLLKLEEYLCSRDPCG
jgi:hypothetical protein